MATKKAPSKKAATKKAPAKKKAATATGAEARLATYKKKRDFAVTPEPSGAGAPASLGNRFVVQRHRARRLHYDLRLEADGVLVSWAVPKGPTLDPDAKRMAVHVEDHPLDYFDFEGVIPSGEYGGGDVIVWDWGTWELMKGTDAIKEIEKGDLHFELSGEKLKGRFVLVRRDRDANKQWLLLHKHDDAAIKGWDAEDHLQSVKTGRTNDEVKEAPAATWSSTAIWAGPTPDELAALDALGKAGEWTVGAHTLKLTNLDKVLFPAKKPHRALTKRDLIRHYASVAPAMLPYLSGRPVNLRRFPNGIDKPGFWHKAAPAYAPDWLERWHYDDARPGDTEEYFVLDSAAALAWAANYGAIEVHPWTSTTKRPHNPTWALVDLDPGPKTTHDDLLVLARLHRTALDHLGVKGMPKLSGQRGIQIWIPVAETYTFDDTRAWVEALSRTIGQSVPELVSWEWSVSKRGGLARLDFTQNAINKTLVAPFSPRPVHGAPVSVPITWDELDDPDLTSDRWTIDDVGDRLAEVGDPLAPLVGMQQRLPSL